MGRRRTEPKPRSVPRALTARQEAFCREYLVDYNGQRAARAVGYAHRNARITASQNLTHPNIQKELARLSAPLRAKAALKASDVLELIQAVANGDVRELFEKPEGEVETIKQMRDLGHDEQRLVAGYKRKADGSVEVRFESRMRAAELLAKHFGLLKEHIQLETATGLSLEEQEKIRAFSDEQLKLWNDASDTQHYLLFPEERPQKQLPA